MNILDVEKESFKEPKDMATKENNQPTNSWITWKYINTYYNVYIMYLLHYE